MNSVSCGHISMWCWPGSFSKISFFSFNHRLLISQRFRVVACYYGDAGWPLIAATVSASGPIGIRSKVVQASLVDGRRNCILLFERAINLETSSTRRAQHGDRSSERRQRLTTHWESMQRLVYISAFSSTIRRPLPFILYQTSTRFLQVSTFWLKSCLQRYCERTVEEVFGLDWGHLIKLA